MIEKHPPALCLLPPGLLAIRPSAPPMSLGRESFYGSPSVPVSASHSQRRHVEAGREAAVLLGLCGAHHRKWRSDFQGILGSPPLHFSQESLTKLPTQPAVRPAMSKNLLAHESMEVNPYLPPTPGRIARQSHRYFTNAFQPWLTLWLLPVLTIVALVSSS